MKFSLQLKFVNTFIYVYIGNITRFALAMHAGLDVRALMKGSSSYGVVSPRRLAIITAIQSFDTVIVSCESIDMECGTLLHVSHSLNSLSELYVLPSNLS